MRAKEFLTELGYKGNIGIMEMVKFMQVATPEEKALMKQLIQDKKTDEAWELLQKVTGVKLNEYEQGTDNSKHIFAKLQQLGYTKLGSGVDATVWAKEEGYVIKILMPSKLRQESDNAFLFFYGICKDNTQNPHLPRFIDIGGAGHSVFEINGTPYRQIAMERLQPITNDSIEEAMVWSLSDIVENGCTSWKGAVHELDTPEFWEHFPGRLTFEQIKPVLRDATSMEIYHNLFATMRDLYREGESAGFHWDSHTENVMQRKDGTLVITDPYLG